MQRIYHTQVTKVGKSAFAFLAEKIVILFKDNAPKDLRDYCVLHSENQLSHVIQEEDVLMVGDIEYKILYVGSEVQRNLENLGHITLRFTGITGNLSGSVYVEDKEAPPIQAGDSIAIYRK